MAFQLPNVAGWAAKAAGFNWYKWGLIAALVVSYSGGLLALGYHKASVHCEQEKTELANKKTKTVVREVIKRVPEVQRIEVKSAQELAEIRRLKKELKDAVQDRPENPSCDLSDAEFNGFRELSAKTRRSP